MHQGKLKPADLDKEAINTTYKELDDAGKKGYGKDWTSFPGDGKGELPNELKKNLYMFSGAKTYAMLEQLNGLLYDKDGKLRPYNEYEVFARKLNRQYNRNWLQAEWQTARTAAQMAQKWERLQENKDLFPNLEFRTVGDDRVRKDHQELHGIIKPIDDAFWREYYPPLDWRCRCDVVATAADPKGEVPEDMAKPNFIGNVAKDEEIFTKKGNFFKLLNSNENAVRNMETFKLFSKKEKHKTPKGGSIKVNIFADKQDLPSNWSNAVKMTDQLKLNVEIRAHLKNGWSNPEYKINGLIADLYRGDLINGFPLKSKQIKTFIKQFNSKYPDKKIPEDYAIVFDISAVNIKYDIARTISGKLMAGNNLSFVVLVKDRKAVSFKRTDTFKEIKEKVNSLNAKEEQ